MKKNNQVTLISFTKVNPFFPKETKINHLSVNLSTFSNKLRDFNCAKSLKSVWERAADYLKEIAETKANGFRKLTRAALDLTSEELGLNVVNRTNQTGLKSRIRDTKNAKKSSLPTPKPKF